MPWRYPLFGFVMELLPCVDVAFGAFRSEAEVLRRAKAEGGATAGIGFRKRCVPWRIW